VGQPPPGYDPDGWDKPIICGEGDPEPWTWRRFWKERAWVRLTDEPILVGVDRSGLLCAFDSLGAALTNYMFTPDQIDTLYAAVDDGRMDEVSTMLIEGMNVREEAIRKQALYDQRLKELEILSRLLLAVPELKEQYLPALRNGPKLLSD